MCQRKVNIPSHTPLTGADDLSLLQVHDPLVFCWVLWGMLPCTYCFDGTRVSINLPTIFDSADDPDESVFHFHD